MEKDNFDKFLTNSYLLFSNESRKLISGSNYLNSHQDNNFHSLIGFDFNNFKSQEGKITKKEILALCNNYLTFTDCKFNFTF